MAPQEAWHAWVFSDVAEDGHTYYDWTVEAITDCTGLTVISDGRKDCFRAGEKIVERDNAKQAALLADIFRSWTPIEGELT